MTLSKPLSEYTRPELNALAPLVGVSGAADMANKGEVLTAITAAAEAAGIVLGPATTGATGGVEVTIPEDGIPRIGEVEVAPLTGHPRRAGFPGLPKIGIIDGKAFLLFDRPEADDSWTDPDGKTHVAKATEQATAWAVPLGKPVLVNLPESYQQPAYPGR